MGSLTKKIKSIRKNKLRSSGKVRKRAIKNGTTPVFPVHLKEGAEDILPVEPGTVPK